MAANSTASFLFYMFVSQLKFEPDKISIQIKISADGAKMSSLSNFILVSHVIVNRNKELMASKGTG